MEVIAFSIMSIITLAMLCQWIAWKTQLPAILFLLAAGLIIGPISGLPIFGLSAPLIHPTDFINDNFFYVCVELSVALILFEGCLGLQRKDIAGSGKVVRNLITIGVLITMIATAVLAHYICHIKWSIAFLLGAVTSVSGPTVVVPILRSIRPSKNIAQVIKWEGMLIDPIGALMAALVFTAIQSTNEYNAIVQVCLHILGMILSGVVLGCFSGWLLGTSLRRHWVPDYLRNLFALTCVMVCFVLADHFIKGTGLLAVTIMGVWVGNMKQVAIDDVLDFKEHLSLLLISILFIILAANITLDRLEMYLLPSILLVLFLQLMGRPISVIICTSSSSLNWKERAVIGWIMPRGIVAAAVASLFAIKLSYLPGYQDAAHMLQMMTFLIIIGTVTLQSLTAPWLAKKMNVVLPEDKGFLIIGANPLAQAIAKSLINTNVNVMLSDTNWEHVKQARIQGIPTYFGSPSSEHADWHIDLIGIGRMLGLSADDRVNTIAAIKYRREFAENSIFVLPSIEKKAKAKLSGMNKKYSQRLFTTNLDYCALLKKIETGSQIKTTLLTVEFNWEDYQKMNPNALILFLITPKDKVDVISPDQAYSPSVGWKVIALLPNKEK